jgi:hypothetical protein
VFAWWFCSVFSNWTKEQVQVKKKRGCFMK